MISERIKKIRAYFKMNQTVFGNYTGVKQPSISDIEKGNSEITNRFITTVCAVFNTNKEWLLTGEGSMFINDDPHDPRGTMWRGIHPGNAADHDNICNAHPVCQKICEICHNLPPENKHAALVLMDIFKNGLDSTKEAITSNIMNFIN